ncbi:glutaredoxin 1 [Syncephalis pseudoplumigaleata]|uniref:Glutaredoxin 1 n=1 Tax=Syncephalis pseudoplumigaleata TaxID=1712513 RepID=A0A4P9YW78_9FUNG|nr:glutaredoxin 1 [Syncephalis pseudoplumigaleata]|eukprot:RKP23722.1 glutaredoxin 1 [Syncephalis pseudoplumigaleata]
MSSVQDIVQQHISSHDVMVFSKTYCPYCNTAKKVLKDMVAALGVSVDIFVIELDVEADGAAMQAALAELTGQRTVPNIFIKGKHVGGCDDVLKLQADTTRQKQLFGLA